MADDVTIEKVNDKEILIRLGALGRVTQNTITPEQLYQQLGKYLEAKKSGKPPIAADCVIDYA
jgi:hypothetical protein